MLGREVRDPGEGHGKDGSDGLDWCSRVDCRQPRQGRRGEVAGRQAGTKGGRIAVRARRQAGTRAKEGET